jgi:hypothetical protein
VIKEVDIGYFHNYAYKPDIIILKTFRYNKIKKDEYSLVRMFFVHILTLRTKNDKICA